LPRRKEIRSPLDAWLLKKEVAEELRKVLGPRRARRVARDPHAKRRPRPCGMTVHPGHGCSLGCLYCYVPDMGFPAKPRPYHLSGEELAYALALNPHVVPGRTLAAFGSVTEPLLPGIVEKTLEYLRAVREWLSLPCQISTKLVIDEGLAAELAKAEPKLSVLISVTTDSKAKVLEPGAPEPGERIAGGGNAVKAGLRVDLFLRPIIPGITSEEDIRNLLKLAREHGLKGVVTGSLRLTASNLRRLRTAGIETEYLLELANLRNPPKKGAQVPVRTEELKNIVRKEADALGLQYLPAACAANMLAHNLNCHLCGWVPCGSSEGITRVNEEGVAEFLNFTLRVRGIELRIEGGSTPKILVLLRGVNDLGRRPSSLAELSRFLSEFYKVKVLLKLR